MKPSVKFPVLAAWTSGRSTLCTCHFFEKETPTVDHKVSTAYPWASLVQKTAALHPSLSSMDTLRFIKPPLRIRPFANNKKKNRKWQQPSLEFVTLFNRSPETIITGRLKTYTNQILVQNWPSTPRCFGLGGVMHPCNQQPEARRLKGRRWRLHMFTVEWAV
jgi:hypothetical protein